MSEMQELQGSATGETRAQQNCAVNKTRAQQSREAIEIERVDIDEIDTLVEWRLRVLREVFARELSELEAAELESVALEADEFEPSKIERELANANREYYMQAIPEGLHIACFAKDGSNIVGCGGVCFYREMPSPDNRSGKCAYFMNIYTQKEYRGQGVGTKVVNWLIEQAEAFGAEKIYLETSEVGRPLYEKRGFTDMKDYMKLTTRKG